MNDEFPLVLIEWEDSARPDSEWRHLETVSATEIIKCRSVGFLIHDGADVKSLAPNVAELGTPDAQASGIIRIPARCVTKVEKLIISCPSAYQAAE